MPDFQEVLRASEDDRRDLFVVTARRLGTTAVNAEKDFWVCWTLDALFNRLPAGPRVLFKGGTSLSKAFGLISRFSEDIDVTVFRDDLGVPVTIDELEGRSGKQRRATLEKIRDVCRKFIAGPLRTHLGAWLTQQLAEVGLPASGGRIELDPDDTDTQTLLIWYPSVTLEDDRYVRRAIKIEAGAKSALDPNSIQRITPYAATDVADLDLVVPNVVTIDAERTLWDKIVILHGLRSWYDVRGELRQEGERTSRHYYDVHQLLASETGRAAAQDAALGAECVRHARMFFNRPDFHLERARPGRFALSPSPGMLDALRRDYDRMSAMIFGPIPSLGDVIASIATLEERVNAP